MNQRMYTAAAILALVIGAMAIFAGGQVLAGKVPDYYVIDWLPIYNFAMGILSVFVTAFLIWKRSPYAMLASAATLSLHIFVMVILLFGYKEVVAKDSIVAMTIRIAAWVIILILLYFGSLTEES